MHVSNTCFTIAIQLVQLLSENLGLESLLLTDSDLLRRFKIRGFLDQTGDNMTSVLKGKGNYEALENKKHYLFHISFLM